MRSSMIDAQLWSMATELSTERSALLAAFQFCPVSGLFETAMAQAAAAVGTAVPVAILAANAENGQEVASSHFNQFLNSASSPLICSFLLIICLYFPFKNIVVQKGRNCCRILTVDQRLDL
jgi:hypothetical protein